MVGTRTAGILVEDAVRITVNVVVCDQEIGALVNFDTSTIVDSPVTPEIMLLWIQAALAPSIRIPSWLSVVATYCPVIVL